MTNTNTDAHGRDARTMPGEKGMMMKDIGPNGERREPPFLIEYHHRGSQCGFQMGADSWDDAQDRLRSIGANGRVIGSNVSSLRANAVTLPFAAAWSTIVCWFRNLSKR